MTSEPAPNSPAPDAPAAADALAAEGAELATRGDAVRAGVARELADAMRAVLADPALLATLGPETRRDVDAFLTHHAPPAPRDAERGG